MKTMSSGNTEAGGGDDSDHIIGGQGVGGEHRCLWGFERDHGLNDFGVGLQGTIHSAGATTTGHAGDGQVVRLGAHVNRTERWDFNPPFSGMLPSCSVEIDRVDGRLDFTRPKAGRWLPTSQDEGIAHNADRRQ